MKTLELTHSRKSLTWQDITELETQFEISLPTSYKNFLLSHNGGRPKAKEFPLQNNLSDTRAYVDFFLCINEKDIYDLSVWIRRYKSRVSNSMIPIAVDPGGNLICLSVTGEHFGKVYFWDHEYEVEAGKKPWDKNLYLIANSFNEFMENLR